MRVAVLGAGAMGAMFGAALSRGGADLVLFDRRPEVVEAINRDGLQLSGVMGPTTLLRPPAARPRPRSQLTEAGCSCPVSWARLPFFSRHRPIRPPWARSTSRWCSLT